jgi:hypothetical protein
MDRYEELGLKRSASTAEIRKAYKKLALLLHPDRQDDPELRRLAELQMKRLNETVGPLMEAGGRAAAERDSDIATPVPPIIVVRPPAPPERPWQQAFRAQSLWWFLAGAGMASLFWYSAMDHPPAPVRSEATAVEADSGATGDLAQRIHELEQQVAELRKPERAPAPKGGPAGNHSMAGAWIYQSRPLGTDSTELPRSVNLQISQDGDVVRGEYSSSGGGGKSGVAFHFEGNGAGAVARLPWTGAHGSNGEIELRLLRPNMLEARWWAYGTSTDLDETSSAAILRRVSTP